jgi:two-component system sensor histidine kinase KdpD
MAPTDTPRPRRISNYWPAALVWLLGWVAMVLLDGHIDLANQALILVVAAALAALWLPAGVSMLVCAAAVLAFNYAFVPPRGTFTVDLHQHPGNFPLKWQHWPYPTLYKIFSLPA